MGWEQRRGQKFFYQTVCVDGVQRKRYVGKGAAAESVARLIDEKRQRRTVERQAVTEEQARLVPADRALAGFRTLVELLIQTGLLLEGFHLHNRQWRRRRVTIDDSENRAN